MGSRCFLGEVTDTAQSQRWLWWLCWGTAPWLGAALVLLLATCVGHVLDQELSWLC